MELRHRVTGWFGWWMLGVWTVCTLIVHFVFTVTDPIPNWTLLTSAAAALLYAVPAILLIKTGAWVFRVVRDRVRADDTTPTDA